MYQLHPNIFNSIIILNPVNIYSDTHLLTIEHSHHDIKSFIAAGASLISMLSFWAGSSSNY